MQVYWYINIDMFQIWGKNNDCFARKQAGGSRSPEIAWGGITAAPNNVWKWWILRLKRMTNMTYHIQNPTTTESQNSFTLTIFSSRLTKQRFENQGCYNHNEVHSKLFLFMI